MTKYVLTLTWAEGKTEKEVCAIERSNPKAGVGQILELYLETAAVMYIFQNLNAKLKHWCKRQSKN